MYAIMGVGYAQSYDVSLFDGRIKRAQKSVGDKQHEYKRILKVNRKNLKERKKQYRALNDSVKVSGEKSDIKIPKDSIRQLLGEQQKYFIYTDSLYTLEELASWDKEEQAAKKQVVSKIQTYITGGRYGDDYRQLKSQVSGYRKPLKIYKDSLQTIDSLDREEIKFMVEQRKKELAKEYEEEIEGITKEIVSEEIPTLPKGFENEELNKFKEANSYLSDGLDKDGGIKLATSQIANEIEIKPELMEKARQEMAVLKKVYSEVPDASDLKKATKSNSLKGTSLMDRLVYGGSFQLHVDKDTKVDINPELSYRMSKKFELGIGGTYRLTVATKDIPNKVTDPKVLGIRGFLEHRLFKQYYFHGEYEGLKSTIQQDQKLNSKEWYMSLLAGVERRFELSGKITGQAQLLYNFNSRSNPLYSSPWVFRLGFGVLGKVE